MSPSGSTLAGKGGMQGETHPLTFKRSGPAPAEPSKEPSPPSPSDATVDGVVPARPIPFRGADGQSHLMYELHITNFSRGELRLRRIEVLGDRGPIASFEGRELLDIPGAGWNRCVRYARGWPGTPRRGLSERARYDMRQPTCVTV